MQDVVKHTFGLLSDIPVGNKVLTKLEDPAAERLDDDRGKLQQHRFVVDDEDGGFR